MDFSKVKKSPILLKEENRRFAADKTKEISGYVKMEQDDDKGLVVAIVDNVKFFPKGEYVYKLIFAGTKKEKRCYHMVGNISLSAYGKGEGSFRINPRDLDGSGMALWDFSTAIIAAMSATNSREALHPVLKGSFSLPAEEAESRSASPRDYSPFYNRIVLDNCIKIAKQQEKYIDILPFKKDLTGAVWRKITDCHLFPMVAPGANDPMKRYGHFLYGWSDTHYFLGIPGRFLPEDQPDEGKSGFVFWQPILGMEEESQDHKVPIEERRRNIYGYWIAAINRYNGHIEEIPLPQK
ncbi:MAG: hypothetical protein Q4C25_03980 [Bacillota bacterium]|nr:hypothetical protein [Bacillota bacterium]